MKLKKRMLLITVAVCLLPFYALANPTGGHKYGDTVICNIGELTYNSYSLSDSQIFNETTEGGGSYDINVDESDTDYNFTSLLVNAEDGTIEINGVKYPLKGFVKETTGLVDITNNMFSKLGESEEDANVRIFGQTIMVDGSIFSDLFNSSDFIGKIASLIDPSDYESLKALADSKIFENENTMNFIKENWDKIFEESASSFKNLDLDELWNQYTGELSDKIQNYDFDWTRLDIERYKHAVARVQEENAKSMEIIDRLNENSYTGAYIPYSGNQQYTTVSSNNNEGSGLTYEVGYKNIKITATTQEYRNDRAKSETLAGKINNATNNSIDDAVGMLATGKLRPESGTSAIYEYANKIKSGETVFTTEGFIQAYEADLPYISTYFAADQSPFGVTTVTTTEESSGFSSEQYYLIRDSAVENNTYTLPFTNEQKEAMAQNITAMLNDPDINNPGLTAYFYSQEYTPNIGNVDNITDTSDTDYKQIDTTNSIKTFKLYANQDDELANVFSQNTSGTNNNEIYGGYPTPESLLYGISEEVNNGKMTEAEAEATLRDIFSSSPLQDKIVSSGMEYISGEKKNSEHLSVNQEIGTMDNVFGMVYPEIYAGRRNESGDLTEETVSGYGFSTDGVLEHEIHIPATDSNYNALTNISTATELLSAGKIDINTWAAIVEKSEIRDAQGNLIDPTSLVNPNSVAAFYNENSGKEVKLEINVSDIVDSKGYNFNKTGDIGTTEQNWGDAAVDLRSMIVALKVKELKESNPNWKQSDIEYIEATTPDMDIQYLLGMGFDFQENGLYYNGEYIEGTETRTKDQLYEELNINPYSIQMSAGMIGDERQDTTNTNYLLEPILDYSSRFRMDWSNYLDIDDDGSNMSKYLNNIKAPDVIPDGYTKEEWESIWESYSSAALIMKDNPYAVSAMSIGTTEDNSLHFFPHTGSGMIAYNPETGTISTVNALQDADVIRYNLGTMGYFQITDGADYEQKIAAAQQALNAVQSSAGLIVDGVTVSVDKTVYVTEDYINAIVGKVAEKLGIPSNSIKTYLQPEEKGGGSSFYIVIDIYGAMDQMKKTLSSSDVVYNENISGSDLMERLNIRDPRELSRIANEILGEETVSSSESSETSINEIRKSDLDLLAEYAKELANWYYEDTESFRNATGLDSYDAIEPFLKIASASDETITQKYISEQEKIKEEIEKSQSEGNSSEQQEELISDLIKFLKTLGYSDDEIPSEITYDWLKDHIGVEEIEKFFSTHIVRLERYVKVKVENITVNDNETLEHRNFAGGPFQWTITSSNGNGDSHTSSSAGGMTRHVSLNAKETTVTALESIVRKRTLVTSYTMEETIVLEPFGWEVSRKTVSGTGISGEPNASSKKTVISTGTRTVFSATYIIDDEEEGNGASGWNGAGGGYWIDGYGNVIGNIYGSTDGSAGSDGGGSGLIPWAEFIKIIKNATGYWVNGYGHDIIEGWAVLVITPHGTNRMTTYRVK